MHDPALLALDPMEDRFLMDSVSYDEVGGAYLKILCTKLVAPNLSGIAS